MATGKRDLYELIEMCYLAGYTKEELIKYTQRESTNEKLVERTQVIANDFLSYQAKSYRAYGADFGVTAGAISLVTEYIGRRLMYLLRYLDRNGVKYTGKEEIDRDTIFFYLNGNDKVMDNRVLNALSRAGMMDLEKLYHTSDEQIYRIKSLGKQGMLKIAQVKRAYAIHKGYIKG